MSLIQLKKELKAKEKKQEKVIIGSKRTMKQAVLGNITKAFLANDCSEETRKTLENYSNIKNIEIFQMKETTDELSELLKKPFKASVVSILK